MELALPFVALGGLYVISNQNSEKCEKTQKAIKKVQQETFTNMGKPSNYIPNKDIPPQNYPVHRQTPSPSPAP